MKRYARVQDGIVQEIIEGFEKTEDMRPPAPEPLEEDATADDLEIFLEASKQHEEFQVGEVPIEERFHPTILAQLVEIPAGVEVSQGDTHTGTTFGPPPAPPVKTEAQILVERDQLLATATLRIAPLQDAVDLDDATTEEIAELKAWKQHRVKLSRINTLPGYPGSFTWPEAPQ